MTTDSFEHRVDIIGPIRQEILSGLREDTQFKRLEKHLSAFPDLSLTTDDYVMAAQLFNKCRAKGVQGSNTDFLICAVAVRRQLAIFTTDNDFLLFAKRLPIVLHETREFEPVLSRFSDDRVKALKGYHRYMSQEENQDIERVFSLKKLPSVLGSMEFIQKIKARFFALNKILPSGEEVKMFERN